MTGSVRTTSSRSVAVLIVDRHGGVSELIRHNIESETTRVFAAATGLDGLRVLAENPVDVMLLDPSLPDLEIQAFLRHSRTARPGHAPRIILMSDDPPDRRLVRQFDVHGCLSKPFDIRDLLDSIDELTRPGQVLRRSPAEPAAL